MNPQSVKVIAEKLTEVIQAAGGLGEEAWPYLVRQATVEGWCSTGSIVFSTVGCIAAYLTGRYVDDWDSPISISLAVIFGAVFIISMSVFFIEGLPRLLNPEYYAIQDLLSVISR